MALAGLAWGLLWASADRMLAMDAPASGANLLPPALEMFLTRAAWLMMEPAAVPAYLGLSSLMWVLMMLAMMIPAVLPVALLFGRAAGGGAARMLAFAAGYLAVWSLYGVALAVVQWGLHRGLLLHTMALRTDHQLAAGLLVAAGLYQFTPLKQACLRHCQSPLAFLLNHWRAGRFGALRMGAAHESTQPLCTHAGQPRRCERSSTLLPLRVLMLLMFAGGVMSLGAMLVLAAFILLERLLPAGRVATAVPGLLLLLAGAALAFG